MRFFWWISGIVLAAVWLDRMQDAVRGMGNVADITRPEWDRPGQGPRVSIIVPARDEERNVEASLAAFAALEYENYEIIAVDDRSQDSTGQIMERVAANAKNARPGLRFQVMHLRELPLGWLGKTHAMWRAAEQARGDWILFTDADVVPRPDALRRAIAYAEHVKADHLVLFPTHALKTVGEHMVLAGFQMLFVFGHRPWKVSDPTTRDTMGLGPWNMVRRSVYESIGGFRVLRLEVVEDIKLGELVKSSGFSQHNVGGRDLLRWRWGRGGRGIIRNLTKNLFAILNYRWEKALGGVFLLLVLNALPFVGILLAPGWAKLPHALSIAAIAVLYLGMYRGSGISPAYALLHPVNSALIAYALIRSTIITLWQGGVVWRDTRYSLEELREASSAPSPRAGQAKNGRRSARE